MCRYQRKYILFLLFIFSGTGIFAQTSTISNPLSGKVNLPYSRFGLGEPWDGNNTLLKGMADITSAYADPYAINADNPASFSFLKLTTYEAGGSAEAHTLNTGTQTYNTGTSTLSYMNIGIPAAHNHLGFCVGLRPYTHVYYNLADTSTTGTDTAIGSQVIHSFSGNGSINYFYLGAAGQYKGLSLGFTFGYMFGTITTLSRLINNDTTHAYNTTFERIDKIGGLYWKGGVLYDAHIGSKYTLHIGATMAMQQNINVTRADFGISSYTLVDTFIADTNYASGNLKGTITLPTTYSFGIQFARTDKWMVGIDYTTTQWNQFRDFGLPDSIASQTFRASLGGQYTPAINNNHNYWSRVTYRMGVYYGNNFVYLHNTQMNNYGITFGASLPFKYSSDRIHLGFELGKLGNTNNGLIQDNYFKFSLGVSFNQQWFEKRRYD
jgi:long-subunit fatty acid transport protein